MAGVSALDFDSIMLEIYKEMYSKDQELCYFIDTGMSPSYITPPMFTLLLDKYKDMYTLSEESMKLLSVMPVMIQTKMRFGVDNNGKNRSAVIKKQLERIYDEMTQKYELNKSNKNKRKKTDD